MQTKLSVFCAKLIEAGWLLAVVITPLFFNGNSNRVFEPDKISILRSIVLVMIGAWIIKIIDGSHLLQGPDIQTQKERHKVGVWKRILKTPLVLPTILLAGSYTLSTMLSVMSHISLWGSYLRLQGTYTTFSYIVIFFLMLDTIRRQEQVDRLCSTIILTSLPISLYGILQHYHLDPIAWGRDVITRVGSNMGNPIFLGAYLIMATPITLARIIESSSALMKAHEKKIIHVLLIVCYTCIMTIQLICIMFTQSRGPWLGLLGGFYIFMLAALISLRNSTGNQSTLNARDVLKSMAFTFLSIPVGVVPAYVSLILLKRGWRWLWLSWVFHTLIAAGFLILFNLPHTPFSPLRELPYIGRLGQLSHTESGTGKVRVLVWEGTLNLLKADPLRTMVGYGPETMQLVFGPYYHPDLARYEERNLLPDRSHNETFDTLVNTGVIGLVISLLLLGSIFYYGMKWLGFMETKKQRTFFLFLSFAGAMGGMFIPKLTEGTYRLSGVGLPVGFIVATCIYLMLSAVFFIRREQAATGLKKQLLLIALFSALVAHFIEIQFGIAVAATRVYFWVYAALLVLLGLNFIQEEPRAEGASAGHGTLPFQQHSEQSHRRSKKQTHQATGAPVRKMVKYSIMARMLTGSFMIGVILFTLGFEFIDNPLQEIDALDTIQRSLMTLGPPGNFQTSYAQLWMFFLTWLIGALVVLFEIKYTATPGEKVPRWSSLFSIYTGVTLTIFILGIAVHTYLIRPDMNIANTITFYYGTMATFGLLIALSLLLNTALPERLWRTSHVWIYPILIVLVFMTVFATNVNCVKADIYFKQGLKMEKEQCWDSSIELYHRAISLTPSQDHYYPDLSRALIGKATTTTNPNEKSLLFEEIFKLLDRALQLNPLDAYMYANLGYLYYKWADLAKSPDESTQKLNLANAYYVEAAKRNPYNTQILNQWALISMARGDFDSALKKLNYSLSLDPHCNFTYLILGDLYDKEGKLNEAAHAYQQAIVYEPNNAKAHSTLGSIYYRQGNITDALDTYLEAVRIDPYLASAHSFLGLIYSQLGRLQQAIEENLKVIQIRPDDFISHRNLALLYNQMRKTDEALIYAQEALKLSPENEKTALQNFIHQLKLQDESIQPRH